MQTATIALTPPLSVVVVILGGPSHVSRCLQALMHQVGAQDVEIIVPCHESLGDLSWFRAEFREVQFLNAKRHRTYAELRALGVQKARGRIVALTEDHCVPNADWCSQILEAHASPRAAIGGAVDKEGPDTALNWALYLADYVRYMNPVPEGPSGHLTDCNVSYKRAALDAIAEVWRDEFHEPAVHEALRTRGESLWLSPRIVVHQQRSVRLGDAIRDRYAFGRLFGSGRVAAASPLRRLVYASFAILLPPLLVGRAARHVFHKRRCVGAFFRALPALALLNTVWAWGELVGYLTGRPEASLTSKERRTEAKPPRGQEVLL